MDAIPLLQGLLRMRLRAGLLSYLFVCLFISISFGQIPSDGPPVPIALGSSAGIGVFRSGRWGVVGMEIANPRDRAVEVQARFFFDGAQEVQFGRRMWVPPNARRIAHCPVVPGGDRFEKAFEIRNVLYEIDENGNQHLLKDLGGELQRSMLLLKSQERLISAVFPPMPYEKVPTTALPVAYDALLAARLSAGLTRRVCEVARPNFPDQLHHLDAVDHLLISNESPFSDAATTATIRQWVQRGGRLWVMLDQVPFDKVSTMFGDSFRCSLVDQVELTDFAIVPVGSGPDSTSRQSFERPVTMVRVEVDGVDVLYTVDDWPAAFMQRLGLGRILYTTISPPAWVRKVASGDAVSTAPDRQATWVSGSALQDLSHLILDSEERDRPRDHGLNRYVAERVGYRILPRRPVLLILLTYVSVLGGCGVVLLRRHKAGKLVWLAPFLIIAAATPIAVMAMATKQRVPRTSAAIQVVQIGSTAKEAHVNGKMAIFLQTPESVAISGQGAEAFMTENWGREDAIRELLWTDFDEWSWQNLRMTGGVKMAEINKPVRLETPVRATMTFDEQGIAGRVQGNWGKAIEDAQIHISSRRGLALHVDGDRFYADQSDVLAKDQYVAGNLLNDEQRRRQTLVRALTKEQPERLYSNEPVLLFWTDPLPLSVKVPDNVDETGAALVRMPMQIQRPPAGSQFTIPSTFLPFRSVAGPTGKGAASTFSTGLGEWVGMSTSSETWLRIQLPKEVLPARLHKLLVRLQIDAPSRPLDIAGVREGQAEMLEHRDNPSGVLQFEITNEEILKLDHDGGVLLGIIVGSPTIETTRNPGWRIHDLQLTAFASR